MLILVNFLAPRSGSWFASPYMDAYLGDPYQWLSSVCTLTKSKKRIAGHQALQNNCSLWPPPQEKLASEDSVETGSALFCQFLCSWIRIREDSVEAGSAPLVSMRIWIQLFHSVGIQIRIWIQGAGVENIVLVICHKTTYVGTKAIFEIFAIRYIC